MVFCPSLIGGRRRYSPEEIKEGVKKAYYEIKREEEQKALEEKIKRDQEQFENDFDLEVGEALVNGDVIGTKLHF